MDIFIANIVLFRFKVPHFGGVAGHVGKLLKHELLVLLNGYMIYPQERRGFFIMKKRLCRASIFAVCVTFVSEVRDQQLNKKASDVAKKSQAPMWSIARHLLFSQSHNTQETSPFPSPFRSPFF